MTICSWVPAKPSSGHHTSNGVDEMPERWDCMFVDRIEPDGRIVLAWPPEYGFMYADAEGNPSVEKVRKSLPDRCGSILGGSNESKVLMVTAIVTALNLKRLTSSNGLIARGFSGKTPIPGLQTALNLTRGESLRIRGTTGWLVYVTPQQNFHNVDRGRYRGAQLSIKKTQLIQSGIKTILEGNWSLG
jgi:hypothetical protein